MSSPKKHFIVDPDYEMPEVVRERVRLKEEKDNNDKLEKAKEIIEREFETELDHRQSQLELIEERLNQAQKTLHLLRYVLITSYYNENDKLMNQLEDSSAGEEFTISNKDKLHPAVKKLLQKSSDYKLNFTTTPRKKLKHSDNNKDTPKSEHLISEQNNTTLDINNKPLDQTQNNKDEFDTGRNRNKSKYRIVVGNISKWIPSHSDEDKSTHKWMVYVRGSKESPDISHFVQKVVFYLHPSYQPNDVIEIRDGPFHLARRGWGEFPLRIRIFFQCPLNKPVDIIHSLKLDKTFSGRQTLGNETVVSLLLYDNENKLEDATSEYSFIKEEPSVQSDDVYGQMKSEPIWDDMSTNIPTLHNEHDYCFSGIKEEIIEGEITDYKYNPLPSTSAYYSSYDHLSEHSYCIDNSTTLAQCKTKDEECTFNEQDSDLMYGIKDEEETAMELIEESVLNDLKIPTKQNTQHLQKYMMSNGTIVTIKKRKRPQESLLKRMFHKKYEKQIANPDKLSTVSISHRTYSRLHDIKRSKTEDDCGFINYKKYKVEFPSHMFKNVSEALPYLFKRLPLVTELVSDLDYKCTYPYAAQSLEEYSKWNIGKRLSSEWFQAKTVLKYLHSSHLPDANNWTTKSIIMYARSHGYTPLANYEIFKNKNVNSEERLNGIGSNGSSAGDSNDTSHNIELIEPDVVVDVVNCNQDIDTDESPNAKERLVDPNVETGCSYVRQALLDVGTIVKPEEIVPGVVFNAAERLLLQAAMCLAEDLIRRARANLVMQGNFKEETSTVEIEEINKALHERTQFNVLLKTKTDE